jgi:hypothetical protein
VINVPYIPWLTPYAIPFDALGLLYFLYWAWDGCYADHTNGEPPP